MSTSDDPDAATNDHAVTVRELWRTTQDDLGDRVVAKWLCEVATGLDGDEFLAALDDEVTVPMVTHLDAMLARHRAGEPLQYVLGRWGFRRLDLAVDRRVLIPRPETELVAEVAIDLARQRRSAVGQVVVADLGTGSGAIGLSVASELPLDGVTVWLTDADPEALDVARANTAGIGRPGVNVRIGIGSWFDALPAGTAVDVIVCNPPYVAVDSPDLEASVHEWEPSTALFAGPDGLDDIRRLVAGAPAHLADGGWLVVEIGADQGGAVADLLASHGYHDVSVRRDLAGHDRIAVARRR